MALTKELHLSPRRAHQVLGLTGMGLVASLLCPDVQGPDVHVLHPGINSSGDHVAPRIIPCADACPRDPGRGEGGSSLHIPAALERQGRDSRSIQPRGTVPSGSCSPRGCSTREFTFHPPAHPRFPGSEGGEPVPLLNAVGEWDPFLKIPFCPAVCSLELCSQTWCSVCVGGSTPFSWKTQKN